MLAVRIVLPRLEVAAVEEDRPTMAPRQAAAAEASRPYRPCHHCQVSHPNTDAAYRSPSKGVVHPRLSMAVVPVATWMQAWEEAMDHPVEDT